MSCDKCTIEWEVDFDGSRLIHLCPLHEAAGEMLEILKASYIYHEKGVGQLTHLLERTRLVIEKAEGGDNG